MDGVEKINTSQAECQDLERLKLKTEERKILVTSALPYANGPIHIGHLVEYIQTDIFVRFQKLCGNETYYFCADDTHGTPVMLAARKEGISPEELVERIKHEHYRDLTAFHVEFDQYHSTNSRENKELAEAIYLAAKEKGHISRKEIRQVYCNHDKMFLPDRFVKGTCPKCGAADQYGDSCEVCGSTYRPAELKDPACTICGNPPTEKTTEHIFFKLQDFTDFLSNWLASHGTVDPGVQRKMKEWIDQGLREWDISRDGPYFGFQIPGEENRYFYVWLDAPIGYMASSLFYFRKNGREDLFELFWKADNEQKSEVIHFIGKDITYFHTLFWPALLNTGGFRVPTSVHVHGFLTFNGQKMSKSRGTLIRAETFLKHLDPSSLRYYFAARLSGTMDDIDLAIEDFVNRYNADVVGNFVNLFSRLCGGVGKKLEGKLSQGLSNDGQAMFDRTLSAKPGIIEAYENRNTAKVIREAQRIGDEINRFIAEQAPWDQIKKDKEAARQTVTDALNSAMLLALYLKPVLPVITAGIEELLAAGPFDFSLEAPLPGGHSIRQYRHLAARIDVKQVEAIVNEEKNAMQQSQKKSPDDSPAKEAGSTTDTGIITIDQLAAVDLRVGMILKADFIEGADRLLQISLDTGEQNPRNVIAGIREAYNPEDLAGLKVVCVANLKPRKMKFGTSEAMLLATGKGKNLTLFVPHRDAKAGDRLA